jgi:hypothetical protein
MPIHIINPLYLGYKFHIDTDKKIAFVFGNNLQSDNIPVSEEVAKAFNLLPERVEHGPGEFSTIERLPMELASPVSNFFDTMWETMDYLIHR